MGALENVPPWMLSQPSLRPDFLDRYLRSRARYLMLKPSAFVADVTILHYESVSRENLLF